MLLPISLRPIFHTILLPFFFFFCSTASVVAAGSCSVYFPRPDLSPHRSNGMPSQGVQPLASVTWHLKHFHLLLQRSGPSFWPHCCLWKHVCIVLSVRLTSLHCFKEKEDSLLQPWNKVLKTWWHVNVGFYRLLQTFIDFYFYFSKLSRPSGCGDVWG